MMEIYCCECVCHVNARLTNGLEIYPHRQDLYQRPFWICDSCNNHVGCHYKTSKPTRPLGVIGTKEIQNARMHIHRLIDPVWRSGRMSRGKIYQQISDKIGYNFHSAEIRTIEQARRIYVIAKKVINAKSR